LCVRVGTEVALDVIERRKNREYDRTLMER
jgi:hypothetical protein